MRHHLLHAVVASLLCGSVAYAGNGTVTEEARLGGYVTKAGIELLIYVDEPRTAAEMTAVAEQINRTNKDICDYTEGVFHLTKVRFSADPADKKNADVWWMRVDQGGCWSVMGDFGHDTAAKNCFDQDRTPESGSFRVYMSSYRSDSTGLVAMNGETLAHELGHLIFDQRDEYGDARGAPYNQANAVYGHNRVVDPHTGNYLFRSMGGNDLFTEPLALAGDQSPLVVGSTSPLYSNGSGSKDFWWKMNPGVMQQFQQWQCRDSD